MLQKKISPGCTPGLRMVHPVTWYWVLGTGYGSLRFPMPMKVTVFPDHSDIRSFYTEGRFRSAAG